MKLTVLMGSSGRPVAQSITVWTPTKVAGIDSGLLRSAWSKTKPGLVFFFCTKTKDLQCELRTLTTVAPQSRRKSAGAGLGRTKHLTSYPSSKARRTICLPKVPVAPTTKMLVGRTGVPGARLTAAALHVTGTTDDGFRLRDEEDGRVGIELSGERDRRQERLEEEATEEEEELWWLRVPRVTS